MTGGYRQRAPFMQMHWIQIDRSASTALYIDTLKQNIYRRGILYRGMDKTK